MQITKEQLDDMTLKVNFVVEPSDYKTKFTNELKKLRKKATIKGFRKGMAPMSFLKKMYGKQTLSETVSEVLNEAMKKFIEESKILYLGQPLSESDALMRIDVNADKNYEFDFEFGLSPQINVKDFDYAGLELSQYEVEPTEEELEEEIAKIRKSHSAVVHPEEVAENDSLFVKFQELDESGAIKEGGVENTTWVGVDMFTEDVQSSVVLLSKGDDFDIAIFNAFQKERKDIAKILLGLKEEQLEDTHLDTLSQKFKMTIENINRYESAAMNEDFYKKVLGPATEVATEGEFRAAFLERIEKAFEYSCSQLFTKHLFEGIRNAFTIELPDSFLKKYIQKTQEKEVSAVEIEKSYPNIAKDTKWKLIKGAFLEELEVRITEDEIKQQATISLMAQMQQSGQQLPFSPEQFYQFAGNYLQEDERFREDMVRITQEQKLLAALKEKVSPVITPVSMTEFKDIVQKENEAEKAASEAVQQNVEELVSVEE